ncbi:MAG: TRAP transporter substrate-binding protein [Desulfotomaculales bacterium]
MKNRRVVFLILTIVSFALLLCSCGQKQQQAKGSGQEKGTAKPEQTYTLKMNVIYPPPAFDWEPKKISTEVFAKRVEEATQGRVKIQFFYNSQLVPAAQGLDALKKGVVDLWNGSSQWGGTVPESDAIWLPYGFMGAQHAIHVLRDTDVGKIMDQAYQKQGAKILFYWPSGSMVIISKKPVKSFEDMKGMRVRLGYALWKDWYQRMGAAPINVAVAEQYEALMRGTADATIYPEYTIETYKFDEVCKYITVPAVVDPGMCYVMVGLNTWNSLPEDLRQTIEKVAQEVEKETVPAAQKLSEYAYENAAKKGVQVIRLSRAEFEKFKGSAVPAWEEFSARSPECAQIVKILQGDIKKWEEARPEAKQWYDKWLAQ